MALSKSYQAALASTSNAAGATTNGSAQSIGYGVSGVAQISNGGSAPTVGCAFNLQVQQSGGGSWFTVSTQTAGTAASTTYTFPFSLGVGGAGGDWDSYRVQFTGNTGQAVTVQADAESTTAL